VDAAVELPDQSTDVDRILDYELLMCAAHFIGDGMALHQFAGDFFRLLNSATSQEELDQLVSDEWKQHWGQALPPDVRFSHYRIFIPPAEYRQSHALPASLEENLGPEQNPFRRAIGLVDFQNNLDRQIVCCREQIFLHSDGSRRVGKSSRGKKTQSAARWSRRRLSMKVSLRR
jgi:hypothetical protein